MTAATADTLKQIRYLAGALKAPRIVDAATRLAEQARDAGWTHEDYLAAVLEREVSARNASGSRLRVRAAGFPAVKSLDEFDFTHQPGVRHDQIAALAGGGFLAQARNVVLLGPPGTGKTHLAIALAVAAAGHGHRVLFATATDWVTRLSEAHQLGRLSAELARLRRYQLIVIDLCRGRDYAEESSALFTCADEAGVVLGSRLAGLGIVSALSEASSGGHRAPREGGECDGEFATEGWFAGPGGRGLPGVAARAGLHPGHGREHVEGPGSRRLMAVDRGSVGGGPRRASDAAVPRCPARGGTPARSGAARDGAPAELSAAGGCHYVGSADAVAAG